MDIFFFYNECFEMKSAPANYLSEYVKKIAVLLTSPELSAIWRRPSQYLIDGYLQIFTNYKLMDFR